MALINWLIHIQKYLIQFTKRSKKILFQNLPWRLSWALLLLSLKWCLSYLVIIILVDFKPHSF